MRGSSNDRLRILHLEDDPDFASLVQDLLDKNGLHAETLVVNNREDFGAALDADCFDLILGDYCLPNYTGIQAFDEVRQRSHDTPFFLVSGVVSESAAIESLNSGVTDYIPKSGINRLVPAARRALREVEERKRAKLELLTTRADLQELIDHTPAVIYRLKIEGQQIIPQFVSENLTRLLGFELAEVMNYEWWLNQLHPEDRNAATAGVSQTLQCGSSHRIYRLKHKDGSFRWVDDNLRLIRDAAGQPSALVGVLTDITSQKHSIATIQRLADIVESSNDAILSESLDGLVTSWNPAAERLTGYSAQEMIGHPLTLIIPPDRECEERDLLQRVGRGETTFHYKARRVRKDGAEINVAVTVSPIKDADGRITGASKIVRDITAQKQAEAKLEEMHRQLREAAVRSGKAEMARTVVHNIGNVLNGIIVSAGVLAQQIRKSKASQLSNVVGLLKEHKPDLAAFLTSDPKGAQIPDFLEKLAGQLAREQEALVNELRFVNEKAEHVRTIIDMHQNCTSGVVETLPVAELVEAALRMNSASMESRNVQTVSCFSSVPPITTERHKVLQILVNLVTNATQAVEQNPSSDRRLEVHIRMNGESGIHIAIKDNGMGIAPENLAHIFQEGFTTRKDGHGLGLHGSALLARELGGALRVQSDGPGKGADFTLELPLQMATH